jgi:protein-L-isoaspartate(D-aspartate) O-methyltransferase
MPIGPEEGQQITIIDKGEDGELVTRAIMSARFSRLET